MDESTKLLIENASELDSRERRDGGTPFSLESNEKIPEKPLSSFVKNSFGEGKFQNNVPHVPDVPVKPTIDLAMAIDATAEDEAEKLQAISEARLTFEMALRDGKDNPAIFASPEFIEAGRLLFKDDATRFEYRSLLKREKPTGVKLSELDDLLMGNDCGELSGNDSIASELIGLVNESCELFFDDQNDAAYVAASIGDAVHILAIGSKQFTDWLSFTYYNATKAISGTGASASESAIKQASFALSGIAKYEGDHRRVYLRMADANGGHYIFIGDEARQVIEVLPTGWRIIGSDLAPVKFWHPPSGQPLPMPKTGGNLNLLWDFVNIPEHDRLLVLAWMLESFRAETPFPILALSGQQGCAKSSTQNKLRQLIDNNSVNLRAAPKCVEDVFVSAGCNWLASFENISHLSSNMQDALCTLATGGGFAARTLYTNKDETIIEVKRPVVINSIPNVVTAQDLTDRAISIELPRIEYREESEISEKWEAAKPEIMGGLMDLFVFTLANLPRVTLTKPPRMADFTRLGEAMALALDYPPGTFDALYKANRANSIANALESSPVGVAVRELVDGYNGTSNIVFYGTVKSLYEKLSEEHRHASEGWPRSPKGMSEALKRQSPALSSLGIDVEQSTVRETTNTGRGLTIKIFRRGNIGNFGNIVLKENATEKKIQTNSAAFSDKERF